MSSTKNNKELKFNFPINDLEGSKMADANKVMAGLLMAQKKGDAVKYFDWAMQFNKGETVTVDEADFTIIKDMVKDNEDYLTMLSKAQLRKHIEAIK